MIDKPLLFILGLFLVFAACDEIESKPELVSKLRSLGVQADRLDYTPSPEGESVSGRVSFFFVAPISSQGLNWEAEEKTATEFTELSFEDAVIESAYSDFKVLQVNASFSIPSASNLDFREGLPNTYIDIGQRFYIGDDEEQVQFRIPIYRSALSTPPNLPSLGDAEDALNIRIEEPAQDSAKASGLVNLRAVLENETEDRYRISWLVGQGIVERVRAIETDWDEVGAGRRSVIVTVRGIDSGVFDFDVIEFTAQ